MFLGGLWGKSLSSARGVSWLSGFFAKYQTSPQKKPLRAHRAFGAGSLFAYLLFDPFGGVSY